MKNFKWLAAGAIVLALVFAGYGFYTGKFTGGDVVDAGKAQIAGGDALAVLCTKYVAKANVVIAPPAQATTISNAVPNTEVVTKGATEGSTNTTVTPGPVPLGIPLPEGSGTPDTRIPPGE